MSGCFPFSTRMRHWDMIRCTYVYIWWYTCAYMYMYDVDTDMHMMHIPIYVHIYIIYIYIWCCDEDFQLWTNSLVCLLKMVKFDFVPTWKTWMVSDVS